MAHEHKHAPAPWVEQRQSVLHKWEVPIFGIKFVIEWILYYLGRWGVLKIIEYGSFLSVVFAVGVYWNEAPDRQKQKHYQAWQVINTAQGKGGSGGRIEAMQELNMDKIPLVGVDVGQAFLQGVKLPKANLTRSDFQAADLRDCVLEDARMDFSNLHAANFRGCDLKRVHMADSDLESADLFGTDLSGADLSRTSLKDVDLRYSDLKGVVWSDITSMEAANVYGVKNAPAGFVDWALKYGAVSNKDAE